MIRTSNRAALYARFSSDNQRSESIDAQIRAMTQYCEQNHLIIINKYCDEAKSATSDKRPAFQEMVHDASLKMFDIVLVHKLDRFARNRYDSAVYRYELKKNGVRVCSVLENLDDSPESVVLEAVLEGFNEYYSKNLSREVMKGLKENAYAGKHTGGRPPYGFTIRESRLAVNEAEAKAVKLIFNMYADGCGYGEIIEELDRNGYTTRSGNSFAKNSLHDILVNEKYHGVYVFNKSSSPSTAGTRNSHEYKPKSEQIIIPGGCPSIIDEKTFEIVQARIQGNKQHKRYYQTTDLYLLTGKIYCGICGRAMYGNTHESGQSKTLSSTYRCPSKRSVCDNREINRKLLEAYVLGLLEKNLLNNRSLKQAAAKVAKYFKNQNNLLEVSNEQSEGKLEEVNTAISNITAVIEQGLSSEALLNRLEQLERQKAQLQMKTATVEMRILNNTLPFDPEEVMRQYRKLKETPNLPPYRAFIQDFLGSITIYKYRVEVTIRSGLGFVEELDEKHLEKTMAIYGTNGRR